MRRNGETCLLYRMVLAASCPVPSSVSKPLDNVLILTTFKLKIVTAYVNNNGGKLFDLKRSCYVPLKERRYTGIISQPFRPTCNHSPVSPVIHMS